MPRKLSVKLHAGKQLCGKLGDLSVIFTVTVKQGVSYTQCACACVCACLTQLKVDEIKQFFVMTY